MMLPDAIDHDAGGEMLRRAQYPLGQFQSAAAGVFRNRLSAKNRWEVPLYDFAAIFRIAANLQLRVVRLTLGDSVDRHDIERLAATSFRPWRTASGPSSGRSPSCFFRSRDAGNAYFRKCRRGRNNRSG